MTMRTISLLSMEPTQSWEGHVCFMLMLMTLEPLITHFQAPQEMQEVELHAELLEPKCLEFNQNNIS